MQIMTTDTLDKAQEEGRAPWTNVMLDTRDFIVYEDIYPVTEGHTLVVPKEATQDEILKCFKFALAMGQQNIEADNNVDGYNIGINMGVSAGQTCMYPHVHLIFRRDGDMEDPKGGVRGVIPSKQKY
ncbi:MAG: HIT family protein [Euryarchaeota archaeon]|jgi:ATP adenylyltransferase